MDTRANNVKPMDTDEDILDPMDSFEDDVNNIEKPGDAAGRGEDVHGSGVYPASRLLSENDASLVAPAAIGNATEEDNLADGDMIDAVEISLHDWVEFLEDFTDRNMGRFITVEMGAPDAGEDKIEIMIDCLPLMGISSDFKDGGEDGTIQIMAGEDTSDHMTHTITEPTFIYLYQDEAGEDEALEIESGDSPTTFIRFE